MKWFAFIMTVLVATQQSQAVDPVTAAAVVGTAIESGGKLVDLMKKLQDMFIKPITDQVDAEIKRVNVDIDGITKEEKQMVDNAKINLYNSRFDITRTRSVLSVLATETNYRSNTLIRILRLILRRTTPTATLMIGINVVVKKMQTLLERSKKLLHDAREQYEEVQKKMNIVRVKLETFATRVNHIGDVHGQRYTDYAKKMRTIVYASAAACVIIPPSCPAVYAACAAALETKLTKYRNDVAELKAKAKNSGDEALKLVTKTKDDLDYMAAEDQLIGHWQSKVQLTYDDFLDGDYLGMAIDMDEFEKDYSITRLEELKTACTNYLKHVAATQD
jgi:uncharacterized protein YoxC